MMPSKAQNDLEAVAAKLDAAFPLPSDCQGSTSTSLRRTCQMMLEEFKERLGSLLYHAERCISSTFPFSRKIRKSKLLEDRQLFEAIMFAEILKYEYEYEMHPSEYDGQLVWLEMCRNSRFSLRFMMLIFQNRMIYQLTADDFDKIRQDFQKSCEFFKNNVEQNQSSVAAPAGLGCNYHQHASHAMTEEVQKLMQDELSSFGLDPRIERQFAFDMKVLPVKDVCYWRDRLELLRLCSSCRVSQVVVQLERPIEHNATCSASMASETVSKREGVDEAKVEIVADPATSIGDSAEDGVDFSRNADERAEVSGGQLPKPTEVSSLLGETSERTESCSTDLGKQMESNQDVGNFGVERMQNRSSVMGDNIPSSSRRNIKKQKTNHPPAFKNQSQRFEPINLHDIFRQSQIQIQQTAALQQWFRERTQPAEFPRLF